MDISKALLHQNPQVETAIMTDLNRAVASAVENGAINGSGSSGQPTGAIKGVTNMLMTLKKDSEGSPIIVVFDAKGKTFRNDIYKDYKANRPPMPDDLREQLQPLKEIVRAIGFPLIEIAGVEADDVIATLVKIAKENNFKTVISSLDKDLMQPVEDAVSSIMNTMTHQIFNEAKVFEKFEALLASVTGSTQTPTPASISSSTIPIPLSVRLVNALMTIPIFL